MVSLYPIWKADNYSGQSRRGQDLLCHCLLYTSYSEVFFTSFDSDVLGLYDHLYECENIDELNELGHAPVSYTHLDVYKRQPHLRSV